MTLAVGDGIVSGQFVSLTLGWDAGGDAAILQSAVHPVRGIGFVGDQDLGFGQVRDETFGSLVIASLAFGEMEQQRPSAPITHDMQLAG